MDTSSPAGEMVANVMMAVSQCERRTVGPRMSDAMQPVKCQRKHMGRRSVLPEATATRLLKLRTMHTFTATADALNAEDYSTATCVSWNEHLVCKTQHRLSTAETARLLREVTPAA